MNMQNGVCNVYSNIGLYDFFILHDNKHYKVNFILDHFCMDSIVGKYGFYM